MDDSSQTPEELAAHFGPNGPVACAQAWLDAVIEANDWALAWSMMTDDLRLVRSQAWLWNNRELFERAAESLDEQADMLSSVPSTHPYWDEFADIEVAAFAEAYPADAYENVGIASRPRPLAPGLELVLVLEMSEVQSTEGGATHESGAVVFADTPDEGVAIKAYAQIVVEHAEIGWLVAGHNGETLPVPGWPPVI